MRHYKKEPEKKENLLEEFEHDVWDIKKIIIGIVILFVLFGGGYYFLKTSHLMPDVSYIFSTKIPHKQGESANSATSSGSLQSLSPQAKLEELKKQVNNLNVSDVVGNSSQVKKLQKDFEALTNLPKDAARKECLQICSGL